VGAGSPWGSGFGSEGNASEFGSAYGFMQVMARARGLDNGLFKAWGSRGELPRAALAAPRAGEDTRGARQEAGASSRARPWQPPPARDRPGAAGASSRAGPCQPAARARTGRGARLEAGASSRGRGFGSEGNASAFGSAYWFMQVMAWARGLDNGLFKAAKHSYLGSGMCMAHTLMLARFTCCEL